MNLKELAKLCNVSPSTVSRVINENGYVKDEKKKMILSILEKNGYKKNIALKQKQYFKIGIIIPNLENKFYNEIIENFVKSCFDSNYLFSFFFTNYSFEKEADLLNECLINKMNAILYIPFGEISNNKRILSILKGIEVPLLILDNSINISNANTISLDNHRSGYLLAELLIKNGHKKILFLNGDEYSEVASSRKKGIYSFLYENNLENSISINTVYSSFHNLNISYNHLKEVDILNNDYSVIIAGNNIISAGCIKYFRENDIEIGKDIAFVSFDDSSLFDIFNLHVSVTAANLKFIGEFSYKILSEQLLTPDVNKHQIKITPKLILRGSEVLKKSI